MRRGSRAVTLTAAALLIAFAAAPAAGARPASDKEPPRIDLAGETDSRCEGERTELRVRVSDASATRTVTRLDGRVLRTTTRKRFTLRVRLGDAAHVVRVAARDAAGNRYAWTLRLRRCPD